MDNNNASIGVALAVLFHSTAIFPTQQIEIISIAITTEIILY